MSEIERLSGSGSLGRSIARPELRDVSVLVWLVATVEMALFTVIAYFGSHDPLGPLVLLIRKEGMVEWMTILVLIPGAVAGFLAFGLRHRLPRRWLGYWVLLCALGLCYFAGEEASWGQHVFKWTPSEGVAGINRQDETNLHNLEVVGTLFGRKPKQIIEAWTIVGCIIVPLVLLKRKPALDPQCDWAYWFWPTRVCMVSALLATLIYLPTRIAKSLNDGEVRAELRWSEVQEFYFAWTLMLYVVSIYIRLSQMPDPAEASDMEGKADG